MLSFSHRSPPVAALEPNRLSRAVDARRAAGLELLDLRQSNPSHDFPQTWLDSLTFEGSRYQPSAFGLLSTRTALSAHISGLCGGRLEAQDLLLGASTSEAYSLLFKLLCNAGDSVLAPSPSYPLLDALCRLESIELQEYPLFFEDRQWHIDFGRLEAQLHPRCRAIVVIAPNNPTGSLPSRQECLRLAELAHSHQLAIIADEVFADFPLSPRHDAAPFPWALHCPAPLCFSLGGLSKSALLPQLKLAWILVGGDAQLKHEAIERLEYIFDTYLSVSTPVQRALPSILQRASAQVEALRQRLRDNALLLRRRNDPLLTPLPIEAGWTAVLRVPRFEDDENLALRLVERGVWVFPGSYYGFSTGANHLVLSLLGPGDELERGLELIADSIHADAHC